MRDSWAPSPSRSAPPAYPLTARSKTVFTAGHRHPGGLSPQRTYTQASVIAAAGFVVCSAQQCRAQAGRLPGLQGRGCCGALPAPDAASRPARPAIVGMAGPCNICLQTEGSGVCWWHGSCEAAVVTFSGIKTDTGRWHRWCWCRGTGHGPSSSSCCSPTGSCFPLRCAIAWKRNSLFRILNLLSQRAPTATEHRLFSENIMPCQAACLKLGLGYHKLSCPQWLCTLRLDGHVDRSS